MLLLLRQISSHLRHLYLGRVRYEVEAHSSPTLQAPVSALGSVMWRCPMLRNHGVAEKCRDPVFRIFKCTMDLVDYILKKFLIETYCAQWEFELTNRTHCCLILLLFLAK